MKILFVDDEEMILRAIERSFFGCDWDVFSACGGEKALAILKEEAFDVIVSDMMMPGMDGPELLSRVAVMYPCIVRVVLSGHADQNLSLKASFIAHQWLDKPCKQETLLEALRYIEKGLIYEPSEVVKMIVGNINTLPSPPNIFLQINQLLESGTGRLDEITSIILQDSALSAKILQLTNSSFFFQGRPIYEVGEAVIRLGAQVVGNVVLLSESYSKFSVFKDASIDREQEECLILNALVSRMVDSELHHIATIATLLHSIGRLILFQAFPESSQGYLKILKENSCLDLKPFERELFDTDHAQVGAYLLFLWGFPNSVVASISRYNDKEKLMEEEFHLGTAIHFAHMLISKKIDDDFVNAFELEDRVEEFKALTGELLGSVKSKS